MAYDYCFEKRSLKITCSLGVLDYLMSIEVPK